MFFWCNLRSEPPVQESAMRFKTIKTTAEGLNRKKRMICRNEGSFPVLAVAVLDIHANFGALFAFLFCDARSFGRKLLAMISV